MKSLLIYPHFWTKRGLLAYLLLPISKIYWFLGLLRFICTKPYHFPVKVVCVGNANVGGTGKTQLVMWLTKALQAKNIRVVIITKAFGSKLKEAVLVNSSHKASEVGDESIMLRQYAPTIATTKILQALPIINSLKPELVILDDGLQNPTIHKDLSILVIDQERGMGNGFLLPAGPLRQYPKEALKIIDLVLEIGIKKNAPNYAHNLKTHKPVFYAQIIPRTKIDTSSNYLVFSGIGDPNRFLKMLKQDELKIVAHEIFPDHHNYSPKDIEYLRNKATALKAKLLTTRKDYVKIQDQLPVICYDVELLIDKSENLIKIIHEKISIKN
jgi:tetraacyldisaccharide 4'-kinase